MSRFNNLEFGDELNQRQETHPVMRDGALCLKEAHSSFARGNFEQALRSYARTIEFEPGCAAAWTGQVRMLIELGEFQEARLWADKALEKFPEESELLAAKAVALARIGDLSAAMLFSDAAVEARNETPYVWLARGDVLLARKERRAEFCFEKALGLASGDWMIRWLIGRAYFHYQQFARALQSTRLALEAETGRAVLWILFGKCQMELGLSAVAANAFEQARQLDPECQSLEDRSGGVEEAGWWIKLRGAWRRWRRV